jgi:2-oxoglutarate dehydrogenase E2 component (dihydrolipoamide succinyltransferase)
VDVVLPQLGESVTEGTISRWLKAVGDEVTADEALVEVSTDKVDTEIPAPASGVLVEIRVGEDAVAPVGAVLGVIGAAGAVPAPAPAVEAPAPVAAPSPAGFSLPSAPGAPAAAATAPVAAPAPAPAPVAAPAPTPAPAPVAPAAPPAPSAAPAAPRVESDGEVYVTPLVRKMAEANGVALSEVTGTGVGGRIRKQDVLAAAEAKKAAAPTAPAASAPSAAAPVVAPSPDAAKRGTTEKMSRLRATIAKRMVESLQVSAQLTATVEVDLTNVAKLRAKVKDEFAAREGVGLTYLAFIAKATTEALKQFPKVNATIDTEAGTITYADAEHLGIAVDTERGLLVPVIANAGDLSVPGLAKKIADLGARTRNNQVTPDELSGGTFTITNYGSAGTLFDTPIINQPQAAILGTGALVKRPMVVNDPKLGQIIAVRDMMYLSRSEERRVGKECRRLCRSRWSPYH